MNKKLSTVEEFASYILGLLIAILLIYLASNVKLWESVILFSTVIVGLQMFFKSVRIILSDFAEALKPQLEESLSDFVKRTLEEIDSRWYPGTGG